MSSAPIKIELDIAVIGGGIAGLWLANRLYTQGFKLALFEHKALGSDQTCASQGMIHGGMKYTLSGALNSASETIADMPNHWRACLCGEGEVDLRNTRLLSDHFYLWSGNSISAKLSSFLASKAVHGRVYPVPDEHRPPLLRHTEFGGNIYKLADIVLDAHSLVTNLANNIEQQCFLIDWSIAKWTTHGDVLSLLIDHNNQPIEIHAKRFIFCAGKGNGALLEALGIQRPAMQLRPLQQVMVKHSHPYNFYGHCLGTETTPRLTISSHKLNATEQVWYLGGNIAERGAEMPAEELIATAQAELANIFPWVDLSHAEWATLTIDRAEPQQPHFGRPENAFVEAAAHYRNLLVAWPTKLTLAPNLANQTLAQLRSADIVPQTITPDFKLLSRTLGHPPIAPMPWATAFPSAITAEDELSLRFTSPTSENE